MGPNAGSQAFWMDSGDPLRYIYRVYSRYIRIPGLSAHTRGPWFQP